MTARWRRVLAGALLTALGVLGAVGAPRAAAQGDAPPVPAGRRVLVLSVPGLTWEDVRDHEVANLRALLDDSAVANASLRVQRLATPPAEGYATLGAGTRAVANRATAGMAFNLDELFGEGTASEEATRQLGHPPDGEVVSLSWRQLRSQNRRSEYDAELGALGDALVAAGVGRGVIGNADGDDLLASDNALNREAALALADGDGVVSCGDVSGGILRDDPSAPFGHQLDTARVLETFRRCATPRSVVLVEASDLRRADTYVRRLGSERAEEVRADAIRRADQLAGLLLRELDLERDAVVVVAPSVASEPRLTVLGIHAREFPAGLLVSGSTRQDGHVVLADVTPSIAALAGADIDEGALEGRAVERGATGGSAQDRLDALVEADAVARFRDRMIGPVATAYITAVCLLALAAVLVVARHRRSRVLGHAALALLGVTPMTYLARALPFHDWGPLPYTVFVVAGSVVLAALYGLLRRRSWLHPLAAAYVVVLAVIVVNVSVLGSRLQLGSVFGDSAIIAGRFNGVNNVMFAQLVVAATGLAAIVVTRLPDRRGRTLMVLVLGLTVFVIAAPMWGADVGGTLAGIPTLCLVGAKLGGWKVRLRTVLLWGAAALAAVVAFGLLDLARDSADQSHLGRLFERIGSEGFEGFATVVERKIAVNLRSLQGSVWRFILGPVVVAAVIVAWRAPGRFRDLVRAMPALRAVLPGLVVGLVLGYALNDSGIAVPGMMLAVSVPSVVYLFSRLDDPDVPAAAVSPVDRAA